METLRVPRRDVFGARPLPVASSWYRMDGDDTAHAHEFTEIAFVLGGRAVHRTPAGERPVGRGDVLVVEPGQWHAYQDCVDLAVYNCFCGPELFRSTPVAFRNGPVRLSENSLDTCEDLLNRLRAPDSAPHAVLSRLGHLLLLLAEVSRCCPAAPAGPQESMPPLVARATRLLDESPAADWTLGMLSEDLRVDRFHLVRKFTVGTGLTPMTYLAHRRAERAALLLVTTDLPVSEVGRRVGWSEPSHFARRFKAHFGVTATAYRTMGKSSPSSG